MSTSNSELDNQFSEAVQRADWSRVLSSAIRGAKINHWEGSREWSPLRRAILDHRSDILDALLRLGSDPNLPAEVPLLINAAINADIESVQLLLAAGADVNAQASGQRGTALHAAAQSGNTTIVKLLLDAGASPYSIDATGDTPLDVARKYYHNLAIELLSSRGNSQTAHGMESSHVTRCSNGNNQNNRDR